MSVGAAIFVKTPGLSPVKTRLAATVGTKLAEAWYERCAHAVASVADQAGLDAVYWAVAEAAAASDARWSCKSVLVQPPGTLGVKMSAIHRELVTRHGGGILLGADAPQLDANVLRRAAAWLDAESPRLVIGRSHDGGFWLFGANVKISPQRWTDVSYSRSDTAEAFIRSMEGLGEWLELEWLTDLDTAVDLAQVVAELGILEAPLESQRQVLAELNLSIYAQTPPRRAMR